MVYLSKSILRDSWLYQYAIVYENEFRESENSSVAMTARLNGPKTVRFGFARVENAVGDPLGRLSWDSQRSNSDSVRIGMDIILPGFGCIAAVLSPDLSRGGGFHARWSASVVKNR